MFVNFPTTSTFFTDYIKQFKDTTSYIFFFYLFFQEPLNKVERYVIFCFHTFVCNIVKLLCYVHFLFQCLLKNTTERLKVYRYIRDFRRDCTATTVVDVVE